MKRFLKNTSAQLGKGMPVSLARRIYFAMAKKVEMRLQVKVKQGARAWPRNSVLTAAFHPFASDLDLSVFVPGKLSLQDCEDIRRQAQEVKTFFPWLGEINIFDGGSREFLESANYFELQRDPMLTDPLLIARRQPSRAEAAVFLFKMLESDWDNLVQRPLDRVPKWQAHWKVMSEYFDGFRDFEMREILNRVLRFSDVPLAEKPAIVNYLANRHVDTIYHAPLSPALWRLFPNRFCFRHQEAAPLKAFHAETFYSAVSWEVWGLWTQRGAIEQESVRAHLGNLLALSEKVLGQTEPDMNWKLKAQLSLFLEVLEKSAEGES